MNFTEAVVDGFAQEENKLENSCIDKFEGEYAFLSNFYNSPIRPFDDWILYPTVEHAFQAAKTNDVGMRKKIASQPTPGKAKSIGRHVTLKKNWRTDRICVMYECLRAKFEQPELREKLLSTKNKKLVEGNWWGDTYWGVCDGVGENNLGKLLMKIREELK